MSENIHNTETTNDSTLNTNESAANAANFENTDDCSIRLSAPFEQISSMLYYMAECEFLFSETGENYEAAIYNGRGFLLKMFSEGLASLTPEQLQQTSLDNEAITNQQTLAQVKSNFEQLISLEDKDSDKAQQLQQSISSLLTNVA